MTWAVDTYKGHALHSNATGLVCSPHLLVGSVEGVGVVGLGTHHPGHLVDEAHLLAHLEALVEGIDVAQVASRDDDPVGHLPVELLADLNGSGLLALQSQAAAQQYQKQAGTHIKARCKAYMKEIISPQSQWQCKTLLMLREHCASSCC